MKRPNFAFGWMLSSLASLLFAAFPADAAEIGVAGWSEGPVAPYTLIRCDCVGFTHAEGDWVVWKVRNARDLTKSADVQAYAGGFQIVWTAPPGAYVVEAVGELGSEHVWLDKVVQIGDAPPTPPTPPGPEPPVPPTPDIPDGKYKLARLAYDAAMAVPAEHRSAAAKLAENYEFVANGIHGDGAGSRSINSIAEAQAAIRDANGEVLGQPDSPLAKAWFPFLGKWAERVGGIKPDFPDDLEAVFSETSVGLKAVK